MWKMNKNCGEWYSAFIGFLIVIVALSLLLCACASKEEKVTNEKSFQGSSIGEKSVTTEPKEEAVKTVAPGKGRDGMEQIDGGGSGQTQVMRKSMEKLNSVDGQQNELWNDSVQK